LAPPFDREEKSRRTYSIQAKIFISAGDHDFTDNIVHASGPHRGGARRHEGLSLFLVPKYGSRPTRRVASPTTSRWVASSTRKWHQRIVDLRAQLPAENGQCIGELVGPRAQGHGEMFRMMNEARIGVGVQGLAVAGNRVPQRARLREDRKQGSSMKN